MGTLKSSIVMGFASHNDLLGGTLIFRKPPYVFLLHFFLILFWFPNKVHEDDLVKHYDILKPYLIAFAGERLPSAQDHQAWKLGTWHTN